MLSKQILIDIISQEISERKATHYDTTEEVKELEEISILVENESSLNAVQYAWLCDLVATDAEIRGE